METEIIASFFFLHKLKQYVNVTSFGMNFFMLLCSCVWLIFWVKSSNINRAMANAEDATSSRSRQNNCIWTEFKYLGFYV